MVEFSYRVRTGHGKPGKSWNLSISVSRPGKVMEFNCWLWKGMENYSVCGTEIIAGFD